MQLRHLGGSAFKNHDVMALTCMFGMNVILEELEIYCVRLGNEKMDWIDHNSARTVPDANAKTKRKKNAKRTMLILSDGTI